MSLRRRVGVAHQHDDVHIPHAPGLLEVGEELRLGWPEGALLWLGLQAEKRAFRRATGGDGGDGGANDEEEATTSACVVDFTTSRAEGRARVRAGRARCLHQPGSVRRSTTGAASRAQEGVYLAVPRLAHHLMVLQHLHRRLRRTANRACATLPVARLPGRGAARVCGISSSSACRSHRWSCHPG